jgi:SOS-response transcriptional repressor LexA
MDRLSKESDQLSSSVVHRLESGSRPVTVTTLFRFAQTLSLTPKDLFEFPYEMDGAEGPQLLSEAEVGKAAYKTHLPLYSLRAAAGHFGSGESVRTLGWIEARDQGALRKDMFVAQAIGSSMEPKICDGDYLVFRANPAGTRQGKIVLAQYRGMADPDTGGSFTVKLYAPHKGAAGRGRDLSKSITLKPLNRQFKPIELQAASGEDFRIVGEYLYTLRAALA